MPAISAFVAVFEAKALNCTELLKSCLAGGNRIINYHRQTNRYRQNGNIWQNTWSTFFIRIRSVFYLFSQTNNNKKTNTLHLYSMCGGKEFKAQREDHAATAYHGCKNLTHTSKIRHVKRIQMVVTVTVGSRFAFFLLLKAGEESNATKLSREEIWSLKTRTVARKSWIGGLNLRKGNWHSEILIKSSLIYSVSYLNSEGLSLPVPTVAIGLA